MTAMEAKRAELETLAAENPGCLTVPAVAEFLDLKPDRVQDWLESANCRSRRLCIPPRCRKGHRQENGCLVRAMVGCTTGSRRSPFITGT